MKKLLLIILLLLALPLVSCDGETPSESLPSESVPEVSTHVCDFSGRVKYDENGHFVTCECGEVSRNEHEFEDLEIIKEATCVEEGSKTVKCKDCKYQETVTIPKLEHTTVKYDEAPATCLKEGVSSYERCDICDIDIGKTAIPKLEHDFEDDYCTVCESHKSIEYITFELTEYGWVAVGKPYDGNIREITELIIPTHTDQGEKVVGIEKLVPSYLGNCSWENLKKVVIPDGIKYVFKDAFSGCYYLEEVVFLSDPSTEVEIHGSPFYHCNELKEIKWPEKFVLKDAERCFYLNKKLKSIEIPEGTTTLWGYLFKDCISLRSVKIPDTVTTAGTWVFNNCYSLKEVDLGNGITNLSYEMFKGCSALETIVIPDSVTYIDRSVFYGCDELKNVVLSKNLKTLNDRAFTACTSLESITIPKSVEYLGSAIFENCNSLKEINYEGTIEEWNNIPHVDKKSVLSGSKVEKIICSDGVIEL
ncbi:MAG: leucine-rich repeat domain-containing protein [Clostridia bacterium]|nr:leucine-rich repeat domain-containing protein [Clostridia bacterium]